MALFTQKINTPWGNMNRNVTYSLIILSLCTIHSKIFAPAEIRQCPLLPDVQMSAHNAGFICDCALAQFYNNRWNSSERVSISGGRCLYCKEKKFYEDPEQTDSDLFIDIIVSIDACESSEKNPPCAYVSTHKLCSGVKKFHTGGTLLCECRKEIGTHRLPAINTIKNKCCWRCGFALATNTYDTENSSIKIGLLSLYPDSTLVSVCHLVPNVQLTLEGEIIMCNCSPAIEDCNTMNNIDLVAARGGYCHYCGQELYDNNPSTVRSDFQVDTIIPVNIANGQINVITRMIRKDLSKTADGLLLLCPCAGPNKRPTANSIDHELCWQCKEPLYNREPLPNIATTRQPVVISITEQPIFEITDSIATGHRAPYHEVFNEKMLKQIDSFGDLEELSLID